MSGPYLRSIGAVCLFLTVGCVPLPRSGAGGAFRNETVFLLHGMGRSRASMALMARRFRQAGYRTVNFPYRQGAKSLDVITDELLETVRRDSGKATYHLVGHSLGSIIIRNGFKKGYPPGLGRVVMLAPPNSPARLAIKFKENPLYRWITGDSGQKLSESAFYAGLPIPTVEFGVIAGDKGTKLLSTEPNDGIVLVEDTKLAGMRDFVVLHHAHTFIMNARDTFERCRRFLELGLF